MNLVNEALSMSYDTLMIIPLIFFCFIPVLDKAKSTLPRLILKIIMAVIFMEVAMFGVYLIARSEMASVFNMLLCIFVFFWLYQKEISIEPSHLLFIFVTACLIGSFGYLIYHISSIFSEMGGILRYFSNARPLICQLFFESLIILILFYPTKKYLGWLVHHFHEEKMWWIACVFPTLFIILSRNLIPYDSGQIFTGKAMEMYLVFLSIFLIILVFLYIMFYQVAYRMVEKQEILERTSYLEMQTEQYCRIQEHVQETKRIRHDFHHQLIVLERMLKNKEYTAAENFLSTYSHDPNYTVKKYCDISAINATLNHYESICYEEKITTSLHIKIVEIGALKDIDICVLLGNLLENAVYACRNVDKNYRKIDLKIVQTTSNIIVLKISNPYVGNINKEGDKFMSIRHSGEGQGIKSIQMIAEKYTGFVKVSFDDNYFVVKVLLNI